MHLQKKTKFVWKPKAILIFTMTTVMLFLPVLFSSIGITRLPQISAQTVPSSQTNIRVGIYFGRDNVSTASVRSDTGLTLSVTQADGTIVRILEHNEASPIIVRKNAWFVRTPEGVTREFNPAVGPQISGELTGPIHLQIGGIHPDLGSAANTASLLRTSGVRAWPAYEDGWKVWTGFFTSTEAANAGVADTATRIGRSDITVVLATASRLAIFNSSMEPIRVYGGTNGILTAIANGETNLLTLNGRRYRGTISFRRFPDSDLTVINTLGVEEYLYGVVPAEIQASSPTEALRAQAIAARTYAVRNINRFNRWGFDLTDTVETQVYRGYDVERVQTNLAVDATRGQMAFFNGTLASLFYFSSSGGRTENNINVWGAPLPYLIGVEDPHEAGDSHNYNWQKVMSADEVRSYLAAAGVNLGTIQSITILETSLSERVTQLQVNGTAKSMTFRREATRTIFELPSQLYTLGGNETLSVLRADGSIANVNPGGMAVVSANGVSTVPSGIAAVALGRDGTLTYTGTASAGIFVFTGRGWGHGIGMSQEGAKGFARIGYTSTQILQHYFPGITIQ